MNTMIIDDISPMSDNDQRQLLYHLKIWCDRHPFIAEVKGHYTWYRPTKIFLTSQYSPDALFPGKFEDVEALLRRCKLEVWTREQRTPIPGIVEVDHRAANNAVLCTWRKHLAADAEERRNKQCHV